MSQEADCISFLSELIETGRYNDFDIACQTMEIFVDYEGCLDIMYHVENRLKQMQDIFLDPIFKKISFYQLMIS